MDSLFDNSSFNTNEEENFDMALPTLVMTSSKPVYRCVEVEQTTNSEISSAHLEVAAGKSNTNSRCMDTYFAGVQKLSDVFFTTQNPEGVFGQLAQSLTGDANSIEIHPRKYKIKAAFITEEDRVQVKFNMTKVNANDYCIEMMRSSGNSIEFYQMVSSLRSKIQAFNF
eukprot:CAMPEP_0114996284 /NCGR_PEP_ID=MMETSP0216-20121206/14218_1 /TAXON_ID=223996 /ORGANISM="Protocruzia adherens, Strain Boccale" /LENGTH=168 /DNA_ID=CAMNT_0002360457 /DNA_START=478 /DNA_END=984 /DNA_ORIENTATION=-